MRCGTCSRGRKVRREAERATLTSIRTRENSYLLRTLLLSGMALSVEKLAEVAQGEHDPLRLAITGGCGRFHHRRALFGPSGERIA